MSGFYKDLQGWAIGTAPGDIRNYSLNWELLLAAGETVVSSIWTLPIGIANLATGATDTVSTCQVSTPKIGTYWVSNKVVTSAGQTYNRGFRIVVR